MTRLNPQTTPRFEPRAEKAEIDEMLARLQALSDDHFGFDPEAVNWSSVGSLDHVASDLREITDFLFGTGEYAE